MGKIIGIKLKVLRFDKVCIMLCKTFVYLMLVYLCGMDKVLSLHYLPNVLWMSHFLAGNCIIDVHEHYIKQSYRNRCLILSANGPLALTIPVTKTGNKIIMRELQADQTVAWQRQHWESIKAAYGSSPYFIHYAPYFEPWYQQPVTSIMEFEIGLLNLVIKLLKIEMEPRLSETYIEAIQENDYRDKISPKFSSTYVFKPYLQVFSGKFPFVPNLSVLDLLFNHGPRSLAYMVSLSAG